MLKIISQRKFIKGINASTGILSQQPGSIIRASNVLLTQRGSLQVCDGSSTISDSVLTGSPIVQWIDLFNSYSASNFPLYSIFAQQNSITFPNVTGFNFTVSGAATNPRGNYTFGVVAIGSAGGGDHTDITAVGSNLQKIFIGPFATIDFTWTPIGGVYGYQIYYLAGNQPVVGANGAALLGTVVGAGSSSFSFTGLLPTLFGPAFNPAPIGNSTQYLNLWVGIVSGTPRVITYSEVTGGAYPAFPLQQASLVPGSPGWASISSIPGFSPYGGISGAACPIPQSLQFVNLEILILGNGIAPQSFIPSEDVSVAPISLTNTFQASYPNWQPGVSWITGNQLAVPTGSNNVLFTATQGGVSGSTTPTWNFTLTTQTADGSVIWTSDGPIPASISPRGAAHAVVYAGSLWLFNTSPSTTSDNIDGPTCMKMSDSNNPNSWNPVNTAFVGKDDGSQITGAQPFTIAAVGISPTGSMAVFKEYQTYQVIGVFGSSNFEIQPAQTDMGCLAARSIQFIPGFGVMRYTHLGFAVYDGVNDRLVSEEIRSYLFGGIGGDLNGSVDQTYVYLSKSTQSVEPPMYMCAMPILGGSGQLTKIFCYDLVMKSWVIIDLPSPISALNRVKAGEGNPLVVSGTNIGTIEKLQAGDTAWSGSRPINWGFRTPDVFGEGASQKIFYREIVLRGFGTPAQAAAITIQPTIDGVGLPAIVPDIVPQDSASNQFELRATIFMNGQICHLNISGQGQVVIDSVDWLVDPKAVSGRRVIG